MSEKEIYTISYNEAKKYGEELILTGVVDDTVVGLFFKGGEKIKKTYKKYMKAIKLEDGTLLLRRNTGDTLHLTEIELHKNVTKKRIGYKIIALKIDPDTLMEIDFNRWKKLNEEKFYYLEDMDCNNKSMERTHEFA